MGVLCAGTEKEMQRSGSEEEGRPACNLNEGKEERELEPGGGMGGGPGQSKVAGTKGKRRFGVVHPS